MNLIQHNVAHLTKEPGGVEERDKVRDEERDEGRGVEMEKGNGHTQL